MPKGTNQKLKLMLLSQIKIEKSNMTHFLDLERVLAELAM